MKNQKIPHTRIDFYTFFTNTILVTSLLPVLLPLSSICERYISCNNYKWFLLGLKHTKPNILITKFYNSKNCKISQSWYSISTTICTNRIMIQEFFGSSWAIGLKKISWKKNPVKHDIILKIKPIKTLNMFNAKQKNTTDS